jgi:hypothetical protein
MRRFHLRLSKGLPKLRAAFEAGELQADDGDRGGATTCCYDGPCAIGAMLPIKLRKEIDESGSGDLATVLGKHISKLTYTAGERRALIDLQISHDYWSAAHDKPWARAQFGLLLTELEARYPGLAA